MTPPLQEAPLLQVEHLAAGHGGAPVLFDVSLAVDAGRVLALLGRNGTGKTTAVSAIMGLLPASGGTVRVRGAPVAGLPPFRIARLGLGLVPEGRQVFPTLTAEENLVATAATHGTTARWTLDAVWRLFPRLLERRRTLASRLSGGEQQMLAIGRALMTNPALLILDEATEGLAPVVRAEIWAVLAGLKAEGMALLLIDKNLAAVLRLADTAAVLDRGRTVWSGTAAALAADPAIRDTHLGV